MSTTIRIASKKWHCQGFYRDGCHEHGIRQGERYALKVDIKNQFGTVDRTARLCAACLDLYEADASKRANEALVTKFRDDLRHTIANALLAMQDASDGTLEYALADGLKDLPAWYRRTVAKVLKDRRTPPLKVKAKPVAPPIEPEPVIEPDKVDEAEPDEMEIIRADFAAAVEAGQSDIFGDDPIMYRIPDRPIGADAPIRF